MIKLVRVDHRLLHGQVAFAWTKNIGADCILIASDSVVQNELRCSALRLSKPSGIKLVIKNIHDSAEALNSGVTDKYNLLIIVDSIKDAYRLSTSVSAIKSINLGGVKAEEGKRQISKAVFVSNEEVQMIKELDAKGVEVEIRMVPDDNSLLAVNVI